MAALDVELGDVELPPLDDVPFEAVVEVLAVEAVVVAPWLEAALEVDVADVDPEERDEEELPVLADERLLFELEVLKSPVSAGGSLELSLQPHITTPQPEAITALATIRAITCALSEVSLTI